MMNDIGTARVCLTDKKTGELTDHGKEYVLGVTAVSGLEDPENRYINVVLTGEERIFDFWCDIGTLRRLLLAAEDVQRMLDYRELKRRVMEDIKLELEVEA